MRSYGYVNKQQQAMRQLQLATTIGGSNSNNVNCHCNSSNCSNILTALAGIATLFHFSSSEYFQQYFQQYFHQMSDSLNVTQEKC